MLLLYGVLKLFLVRAADYEGEQGNMPNAPHPAWKTYAGSFKAMGWPSRGGYSGRIARQPRGTREVRVFLLKMDEDGSFSPNTSRQLTVILSKLEKLRDTPKWKAVLRTRDRTGELAECQQIMNQAMSFFQVGLLRVQSIYVLIPSISG